jgi:endonuclease/exonuclease/phosphatase family metal-dependent hydrolase
MFDSFHLPRRTTVVWSTLLLTLALLAGVLSYNAGADQKRPVNKTIVTAGAVSLNELQVKWEQRKGAKKYKLQISTSPNMADPSRAEVKKTQLSHTFGGLVPGTDYYVRVASSSKGTKQLSDWSTPVQVRTLPAPAVTTSNVAVTPMGATSLTVLCAEACSGTAQIWNSPKGNAKSEVVPYTLDTAGQVAIQFAQAPYFDSPEGIVHLVFNQPTRRPVQQDNPLQIARIPASVPSALNAVAGNGLASISWTAPVLAPRYEVLVSPFSSMRDGVATLTAGPELSAQLGGLVNDQKYFIKVRGMNASGQAALTEYSDARTVTPKNPQTTLSIGSYNLCLEFCEGKLRSWQSRVEAITNKVAASNVDAVVMVETGTAKGHTAALNKAMNARGYSMVAGAKSRYIFVKKGRITRSDVEGRTMGSGEYKVRADGAGRSETVPWANLRVNGTRGYFTLTGIHLKARDGYESERLEEMRQINSQTKTKSGFTKIFAGDFNSMAHKGCSSRVKVNDYLNEAGYTDVLWKSKSRQNEKNNSFIEKDFGGGNCTYHHFDHIYVPTNGVEGLSWRMFKDGGSYSSQDSDHRYIAATMRIPTS